MRPRISCTTNNWTNCKPSHWITCAAGKHLLAFCRAFHSQTPVWVSTATAQPHGAGCGRLLRLIWLGGEADESSAVPGSCYRSILMSSPGGLCSGQAAEGQRRGCKQGAHANTRSVLGAARDAVAAEGLSAKSRGGNPEKLTNSVDIRGDRK